MFTKKDATRIAKKLGATPESGAKHDIVYIRYNGMIVAKYGIRRGRADAGHDYIANQLYLTSKQTRELASCTLSADGYFEILRQAGRL